MRNVYAAIAFLACLSAPLFADPITVSGLVELSVDAKKTQPRGRPILCVLTVKNIGNAPVRYWSGGAGQYPYASTLRVSVRYDVDDAWQEVRPTNGECEQGSGSFFEVPRDKSMTMPVAIPVDSSKDYVSVRIETRDWNFNAPALFEVGSNDNRDELDASRADAIGAVVGQHNPFHYHLAELYADAVILDAMLKLVTLDHASIVASAARVLSVQKFLPVEVGNALAPLVAQWAPRRSQAGCDLAAIYLTSAALKTQSPAARRVVLELLDASTDAQVIAMLMDALRLSPGDRAWLFTVRDHFQGAILRTASDKDAAQTAKVAAEWLESRIKHLDEREGQP